MTRHKNSRWGVLFSQYSRVQCFAIHLFFGQKYKCLCSSVGKESDLQSIDLLVIVLNPSLGNRSVSFSGK